MSVKLSWFDSINLPCPNPVGEMDTLLLPEVVCTFTSSSSTYHSLHIQIKCDLVLHNTPPNVGAEGFSTGIHAVVACLVELLGNVSAHSICSFFVYPLTLLQTVGLIHLLHCPIISPFPYNYPNFTTVYFVRM